MRSRLVAAALTAAAALVLAPAAEAAVTTFTVSGFGDGLGSCSPPAGTTESCPTLRLAEAAAEAVSSVSDVPTIELGPGTYALSGDQLQINQAMTIDGAGMAGAPSGTTIRQTDGTNLVIHAEAPSGTVTVENLEVTGGHNTTTGPPVGFADGGGIYNADTLVLDSVLVTGNTAVGSQGDDGSGGGIYDGDSATLTLNNSAVTMNHADGGPGEPGSTGSTGGYSNGGGIAVGQLATLVLTDSSVDSNTSTAGTGGPGSVDSGGYGGFAFGGGIENSGTATLTGVTLDGNTVTGGMGGIGVTAPGGSQSAFGGAIDNGGTLTIRASTLAANTAVGGASAGASGAAGGAIGGAIETEDTGATLTVVNSTLTGNMAAAGSVAQGGNGNGGSGGGIRADNHTHTTLASDTIVANNVTATGASNALGGNLAYYGAPGTSFSVQDSIIAGSTQKGNCFYSPDTGFTDNGHNLEDDASSNCDLSSGSPDDDVLVAPGTAVVAGALAANGGPTQTLALLPGSPAIAAGGACLDPSTMGSPALTVDQRGLPRPAVCDIGSFEHQPLGGTGTAQVTGTPAAVGRTLSCTETGFTGDLTHPAYVWLRDGRVISGAIASTYVVTGADEGHSIACRVTVNGIYGGSASATGAAVRVAVVVPVISGLAQSHSSWREGDALARLARRTKKKPPVGTMFSFRLNTPARVTFAFAHAVSGRRSGKTCVSKTRHNTRNRKCMRTIADGSLSFAALSGAHKLSFDGLISRHKKLRLGRHTVRVSATAAGKTSVRRMLSFTIAR